ncbi:MAG: helix-turn-helix transcriptional regulator [Prevotella sp.]|nr:helix-turn-helix transcriptional regulator [Prevotella sp.]MBR6124631.1 helix-turn-helix transcriptional regulator [Candidatus Saccharibacteria bacterium]
MKIRTWESKGVLAELLAEIDEKELARTRKRMMLAVKIEEAMKRRGLNQAQFAKMMGKSQTVISEWLSGERNFTSDTLTDIEGALGIQLLNTNIMTVVQSGTTSSYTIHTSRKAPAVLKSHGSWALSTDADNSEFRQQYA